LRHFDRRPKITPAESNGSRPVATLKFLEGAAVPESAPHQGSFERVYSSRRLIDGSGHARLDGSSALPVITVLRLDAVPAEPAGAQMRPR
jgi:hypothetical protein